MSAIRDRYPSLRSGEAWTRWGTHISRLVPLERRPIWPVPWGVIDLWRERRSDRGPRLVFYKQSTALHQESETSPALWYRELDGQRRREFKLLVVGLPQKIEVVDLTPGTWEIAVSDPEDGYWYQLDEFVPSQVERFTVTPDQRGIYEVCGKAARWTAFRPRPKHRVDYYYHGWRNK